MKFFEAVANVFRIPDLRKRLLFALALLAVYRLGGHIPDARHRRQPLCGFLHAEPGQRCSAISICSAAAASGG